MNRIFFNTIQRTFGWFMVCIIICFGLFGLMVFPARAVYLPSVVSVYVNTSSYIFVNQYSTSTPLTPTIGSTKTIYVNGRVMDEDGVGGAYEEGNLNTIELQLYRSNIGANCDPDLNTCYRTYCNVREYQANVIEYSCPVDVSYLVDATDESSLHASEVWNAEIIAIDDDSGIDNMIYTIEVSSILSINIPESISFGDLSVTQETTSLTNTSLTFTQQGNTAASLEISGGNLSCSILGAIPVENIEWSLIDVGYGHESSNLLSLNPVNTGVSIGTDDDTILAKDLYFNIKIPLTVSGQCSGAATINAIAE